MLLQFDTYIFEGLKLPESFSGTNETRYSEIPIISGKPSLQRTGQSLNTITIGISFSGENVNPRKELEALDTLRKEGVVSNLVDGSGYNYGKFVITTIDYTPVRSLSNGVPIYLSATINFLEYNSKTLVSSVKGNALSINSPITQTKVTPLETTPLKISSNISSGIIQTNSISIPDSPSKSQLDKISESAKKASGYFDTALTEIQSAERLISRTQNLRQNLTNAIQNADSLATYAKNGELTKLAGAKSTLDSSTYAVKSNASVIAAIIGSREGRI